MKKLLTLVLILCLLTPAALGEEILLSFLGDISIGDSLQYKNASSSFHTMVDAQGYDYPFALIRDYLQKDDMTVGNLEVILTTSTKHQERRHYLSADPDHVKILLSAGIDVLNTSNNHTLDFHLEGYEDSLTCLDENGLLHFGYSYAARELTPIDTLTAEVKGVKFGFAGFSAPKDSDLARIKNRIKKLREEEQCDVVIISLHWGREGQMKPDSWQAPYAKEILDAGADMIWGHGPHVIQPIQFYKGKPIIYSTGNIIFGTMSQQDPSTGIFQVTWEKTEEGVSMQKLQVIPCETQPSPVFQPFELTDEQARRDVWDELTFNQEYKGLTNPPESFLTDGIVWIRDLNAE